ncbi:MAG: GIY-YIG nuclease family protein [Pseudomonadota bacterium]
MGLREPACLTELGEKTWWVYMLETDRGHLYTGVSTDVAKRFVAHTEGRGARCLRGCQQLTLRWQVPMRSRAEALSVERRIKALAPRAKQALWQSALDRSAVLQTLAPRR